MKRETYKDLLAKARAQVKRDKVGGFKESLEDALPGERQLRLGLG